MSNKTLAKRLVDAMAEFVGQPMNPLTATVLQQILVKEIEQFEREQVPPRDPNRSYEL